MAVKLMTALEILGLASILVSVCLLSFGGGAKERKLLIVSLCGSMVQNAGYLLELQATSAQSALTAVKIQYLGSMFVPLFFCLFVYNYCNKNTSRLVNFLFLLLGIIDLCMLAVVFTCDRHTLFYQNVAWLESGYGYHYLSLLYGPLYIVCLICETIIPYSLSLFLLFRAILKNDTKDPHKHYTLFLAISFIPVAALLAYALKLTYVFDPTPVALALSLSLVATLA